MILNLAGVKKSIADKIVPIEVERIINDVVREAFERFIEEMRKKKYEIANDIVREIEDDPAQLKVKKNEVEYFCFRPDEVREIIRKSIETQAKWLKDNLN